VFRPVLAGILSLLICLPAAAAKLSFDGKFVQGGLVIGSTDPGTRITLDGRSIRVTDDGRFVFGFGRDAPESSILQAVFPDDKRRVRQLRVEKRKYRIQRIDGLPSKMVTPSPGALLRIKAEAKEIRAARGVFTPVAHFADGFIWPAKGRISGVYGSQRILNGKPRRPHLGLDIAAPVGTPIVATAAGKVTLANTDMYFTGGTVIIDHGHGLSSVYSHLSAIDTRLGATVKQGQQIGRLGGTGPHLDWRINWFQERLDPRLLVGSMPK
jgi:murein DD-endopeptidase MepM/ murein hydrolase activator NlpD